MPKGIIMECQLHLNFLMCIAKAAYEEKGKT